MMNIIVLLCSLWSLYIVSEGKHQSFRKMGIWRAQPRMTFGHSLVQTAQLRGGAQVDEEDTTDNSLSDGDLEETEEEQDDDEEERDGAFAQRKALAINSIASVWIKTPPMTQIYMGSSIAITFLSFLLNKNVWPDFLHFNWIDVLSGQLWRVGTAFLHFGQLDMFFLLTMQFVWQNMSQLEKLSYNKPEDFLMMMLFGAGSLIAVYTVLGISMKFLGHNFATFLGYIWSRVFEGSDLNFMDLMIIKAEMLPWIYCAQTFLLEQELPLADLIGIAVGHLYYYLKTKDYLKAPEALKAWFQSESIKARYARFKTDFEG